jgi:hypothetical protein
MDSSSDSTSTRGFQSRDPRWHSTVEDVETVGQVVELTRDYLATLQPDDLAHLPKSCRTLRVKAEDDIEYWTLKFSQRHSVSEPQVDLQRTQDIFNHLLHASLRISQIRKSLADGSIRETL